jgi:hypothetical protein
MLFDQFHDPRRAMIMGIMETFFLSEQGVRLDVYTVLVPRGSRPLKGESSTLPHQKLQYRLLDLLFDYGLYLFLRKKFLLQQEFSQQMVFMVLLLRQHPVKVGAMKHPPQYQSLTDPLSNERGIGRVNHPILKGDLSDSRLLFQIEGTGLLFSLGLFEKILNGDIFCEPSDLHGNSFPLTSLSSHLKQMILLIFS